MSESEGYHYRKEQANEHSACKATTSVHSYFAHARVPASVIRTRATSNLRPPPPTTTRSAVAVASPARTRSMICAVEKRCARKIASLQPSGHDASNSSARRRSGWGPWRRPRGLAAVDWVGNFQDTTPRPSGAQRQRSGLGLSE